MITLENYVCSSEILLKCWVIVLKLVIFGTFEVVMTKKLCNKAKRKKKKIVQEIHQVYFCYFSSLTKVQIALGNEWLLEIEDLCQEYKNPLHANLSQEYKNGLHVAILTDFPGREQCQD